MVAPRWSEAKLWVQFLGEVTGGDVPLMGYLQRVAGYCLTGSTNAHALFFLFGAGKNGKSVFLNTLKRIAGDYAVTASMDTLTASKSDRHPTDLARLDGPRLVTASETEEGPRAESCSALVRCLTAPWRHEKALWPAEKGCPGAGQTSAIISPSSVELSGVPLCQRWVWRREVPSFEGGAAAEVD